MNQLSATPLVNLLGFAVGIVLYALLLVMTLRNPRRLRTAENRLQYDFLLLATAVLGLLWNAGELALLIVNDFNWRGSLPVLSAIAYTALGFLPAVVVHSASQAAENDVPKINFATIAAYCLSAAAAVLHFYAAFFGGIVPSGTALYILTAGYLTILATLFFFNIQQTVQRKAIWAIALAVFAVSALHLGQPHDGKVFFLLELVGHQAALPLVVAILLQNFRFAFADLFLKRALSLILLTLTTFGLYVFAFVPLSNLHQAHGANDSQPIFILLGLWIATALFYQKLHQLAVWLVDKILLRRINYEKLRAEIAHEIAELETVESILNRVSARLGAALTANETNWEILGDAKPKGTEIIFTNGIATIFVATAESPFYQINLSNFAGARRLLSDEIEMLEDTAILTARRIDAIRITTERFERELREQETVKLAAQAELRALRAQINPHFLFNALTTIGYLINTAPETALETLLKLTRLLRGVLRSNSEFSTLGDEFD
jgi:hypothetical protein